VVVEGWNSGGLAAAVVVAAADFAVAGYSAGDLAKGPT